MWTEITDLVVFRNKLLKFRQGIVARVFIIACLVIRDKVV